MQTSTYGPRLPRTAHLNSLRPRTTALIGVAAVSLSLASAASAVAATYSTTNVGNLGYPSARAAAINEGGQVAGTSYLAELVEYNVGCVPRHRPCHVHPERPFLSSEGKISNLGSLEGGLFAAATGINDLGEVVGNSSTKQRSPSERSPEEAFLVRSGKMTSLGRFRASVINDSGVVAGSESIPGEGTAAILDSNGKITDLGLLPGEGGIFTDPTAINDSGEVVGDGDNSESQERAWVYRNGTMTDLGTLGGPNAAANGVNDSGEIVGNSQTASGSQHPFLDKGGKMIDLGAFNLESVANAISNNGVIVGETYELEPSGSAVFHAFIYSGGHFQDLNNLIPAGSGYRLENAVGVNNKGQILVQAHTTTTFQNVALVLNPS